MDDADREVRRFRICMWALAIAGAAALTLAATSESPAHQAASGWTYPSGCCMSAATSPTGDCAPITPLAVKEVTGGYSVQLAPGQHPKLLTKGYSAVIPYSQIKPSPDGEYHICLSTDGANRYCFFGPPPGV